MAHLHQVLDDDFYFSIDPASKEIEHLGEAPLVLAVGDHNSERYTFEMPRIVEGHDMMQCDKVEVHYINLGSGNRQSADIYKVTDLQVAADDNNTVMFTWLLHENTAKYVGSLSFAIRFACTVGTKVSYNWRTNIFSGINVIDSTNNSAVVVEQQSDILQEWYMELLMSGTEGLNKIEEATEEAIKKIKSVDVVVEIEQEAITRIENAGKEAVDSIKESITSAEAKQEEIVVAVLNRIPIYSGEAEHITKYIPVYNGEMEEGI